MTDKPKSPIWIKLWIGFAIAAVLMPALAPDAWYRANYYFEELLLLAVGLVLGPGILAGCGWGLVHMATRPSEGGRRGEGLSIFGFGLLFGGYMTWVFFVR